MSKVKSIVCAALVVGLMSSQAFAVSIGSGNGNVGIANGNGNANTGARSTATVLSEEAEQRERYKTSDARNVLALRRLRVTYGFHIAHGRWNF
jgi:hypothetical protein